MISYRVRSFDGAVDAASFRCGQAVLDEYILRYFAQDVRRNVARVFIAVPDSNPQKLAGFLP